MTDLSWRDTYTNDPWVPPGTFLTLERAREPEPEPIGSAHRSLRPGAVVVWAWSLTSRAGPIIDYPRPGYTMSGFFDTQRDALVAAWRHEEAFRAEVRASPVFDRLGPHLREYVTTGQPVPPKWSKAP